MNSRRRRIAKRRRAFRALLNSSDYATRLHARLDAMGDGYRGHHPDEIHCDAIYRGTERVPLFMVGTW